MCLQDEWDKLIPIALKGFADQSSLTFEEKEYMRDCMDKWALAKAHGSRITTRSMVQDVRFTAERIAAEVCPMFSSLVRLDLI